jgi:hypothetical protein
MNIDNIHSTDYFTGAQVRVYFGHILIDEIASIEWAGSSTKRPVYGYASTQFDAVAQGQFLIQGNFIIPFKEVGFMYAIRNELNNKDAYVRTVINAVGDPKNSGSANSSSISWVHSPAISPETPRRVVNTDKVGSTVTGADEAQKVVSTLRGEDILRQSAEDDGPSFNELVEDMQNAIWGDGSKFTGRDRVPRVDEFDKHPTINFIDHGFNILVTFGDPNNPNTPSTVKSLIDVHLTGDQRIVDSSDNPVYEQYSFFCRSADENVGAYKSMIGPKQNDPNKNTPVRTGADVIMESASPDIEGLHPIVPTHFYGSHHPASPGLAGAFPIVPEADDIESDLAPFHYDKVDLPPGQIPNLSSTAQDNTRAKLYPEGDLRGSQQYIGPADGPGNSRLAQILRYLNQYKQSYGPQYSKDRWQFTSLGSRTEEEQLYERNLVKSLEGLRIPQSFIYGGFNPGTVFHISGYTNLRGLTFLHINLSEDTRFGDSGWIIQSSQYKPYRSDVKVF